MIGTDETNFLYDLLLTNRLFASLHKTFANNSLKGTTLLKIQLPIIILVTKSWFSIGEEYTPTINQECVGTTRINSSSLSS